jgi:hypothetical protein
VTFEASVEAAFVAVMRARRPDLRWRPLSEDERLQLRSSASRKPGRGFAVEEHVGAVLDRGASAV